jgi:hypothetical protein
MIEVRKMPTFKVVWTMDIDAQDARDAAEQAQDMLRNDTEIDWMYQVTDCATGITEEIDLDVAVIDDECEDDL